MTSAAEGKLHNFGLRKQGFLQAKGAESVILPQPNLDKVGIKLG
jgi:hypothetical protein